MKKLITILAIMMVLVGAAFATDSAQITLNATVSERVPLFKLTTTNNGAVLSGEATPVDIKDPAASPSSVTIKEDVATALAEGTNQTVTFGVMIAPRTDGKKIKSTHTFTFTVTASALAHTTPALADDNKFTAAVGNYTKVMNQGNPVIPTTYATTTDGASLAVTFNGKSYDPNAATIFATFPVTYTGNPNAVTGAYSGTVTIEVATT